MFRASGHHQQVNGEAFTLPRILSQQDELHTIAITTANVSSPPPMLTWRGNSYFPFPGDSWLYWAKPRVYPVTVDEL